MNKQALKEQVSNLPSELIFKKVMVNKGSVLELIDQLDEPKKVVIPKFVAEWISKNPVNYWWQKIAQWEQVVPLEDKEVYEWYSDYNETTFIQAWIAYPNIKIEQEKLYTVEIPDPNSAWNYTYLGKNNNGYISICSSNFLGWVSSGYNQLTESEIRKDFEWAWQAGFAKEVE